MSILKVAQDRWAQAQAWELEVWNDAEKATWKRSLARRLPAVALRGKLGIKAFGEDWNSWWAQQFQDYQFLPQRVDGLIELGCGPYTNTRLILGKVKASRAVCSDPLMDYYCQYKRTWLARSRRSGLIEVDNHPIETCPFEARSFDVVVMINVLDHVQDAEACLKIAANLVGDSGWLVVGQDLSNDEDIARFPYDIGHPIRLGAEDILPFLSDFKPVLSVCLDRDAGRSPERHVGTLIFAGTRGLT